ncbi:unnamed protein product, partial [Agarophyton chilense]
PVVVVVVVRSWTLRLDAAAHAAVADGALPLQRVPAVLEHVRAPFTLLSALAPHLPHPFLLRNNRSVVYDALERVPLRLDACFELPNECTPHALLVLSVPGVLFAAHVRLNGCALRTLDNAFRPYLVLLPPNVCRRDAANALSVRFASVFSQLLRSKPAHAYREWNDPKGGVSTLRLPQYLAGWDWAPRHLSQGILHPVSIFQLRPPHLCDVSCVSHLQLLSPSLRVQLALCVQLLVLPQCPSFVVRAVVLPRALHVQLCASHTASSPQQLPAVYHRLLRRDRSVLACLAHRARLVHLVDLHLDSSAQPSPQSAPSQHTFMYNPFSELSIPAARTARYAARFSVVEPQLWWPNGMGDQHLYQVHVAVLTHPPHASAAAEPCPTVLHESRSFTVGLRQLQLVRDPSSPPRHSESEQNPMLAAHLRDAETHPEHTRYESLTFSVNGRNFFAKGANYIPSRMHFHQTSHQQYERTISSACAAHMNMLRVWGGGLYENDVFYELCNERGILLWHDFMFSCSLYPGDHQFMQSCRAEAQYQVSRLRNHPCMALWCGNNELEQVPHDIVATDQTKLAYETLFYNILPAVVHNDPGLTPYWPSSPHNPLGYENGFNNPCAGDTHFWDVWHARKPLKSYLSHRSRFCSEFGMQSFLSEEGARACVGNAPGALNPFGPIMEAHQKNASGNFIIMEYCQRLFRAPMRYASLSYQSQLNQMICMQTGVEHFRRSWPYCGGALYWQLNDCWPCFSWSSLEFGGNWKALHYGAKKFFAPLLISAVHHGEETVGVCNLISFTQHTGLFSVYGTFDGPESEICVELSWILLDIGSNQTTTAPNKSYTLKQDTSRQLATVDVRESVASDPTNYVLRLVAKSECNRYESSPTLWLCAPRLCELSSATLGVQFGPLTVDNGKSTTVLEISCSTFAPFVQITLKHPRYQVDADTEKVANPRYIAPVRYGLSDNYFDLFPGESKRVELIVYQETTDSLVFPYLTAHSLADSYMT